MKNVKATGIDYMPIEVWKSLVYEGVNILCDLMNKLIGGGGTEKYTSRMEENGNSIDLQRKRCTTVQKTVE